MKKLIIITGPTATFKTKTSIDLALFLKEHLQFKAVVVNFDSLLFYKEISIGTARPSLAEMQGIPHEMIAIESIKNPINAAHYIKQAYEKLNKVWEENALPILVGGSAFYLRALLKGMYDDESQLNEAKDEITSQLKELYQKEGIRPFIEFLEDHDPESLKRLHPNDHYRLQRAVLYYQMNHKKISEQFSTFEDQSPYDFSQLIHPWDILHINLDLPKDLHYELILKRTQNMFDQGLIAEILELKNQDYSLNEKPLQSIGYKEAILYIQGQFKSEAECIERIAISTRQLAKSQRTFFKKINPKECFNPLTDQSKIQLRVREFLQIKP